MVGLFPELDVCFFQSNQPELLVYLWSCANSMAWNIQTYLKYNNDY